MTDDSPTRHSGAAPDADPTLGPDAANDRTLASEPGAPVPGVPASLSVPGFRIVGKLGEGGMGIVFEAEQESPRRRVALKIVRGGPIADELQVRLFRREADVLARLEHPNIAAIYESGRTDDGHHYFAMELVDGESLDVWLARTSVPRPLSPATLRERLAVFRAVCDAVQFAHQRGVIHRDLKPANLIVPAAVEPPSSPGDRSASSASSFSGGARPRVKVLDFGLARLTDPETDAATVLSRAGGIKGTLPYMSPEQARGEIDAIDVRTDVYALGVILHEMLTGRRPYDLPSSLLDAVKTIAVVAPRPLAESWIGPGRPDSDLETIVGKALEKEPDDRYASAAALGEDVGRWLASEPILARPPSTMYQIEKLVARHKGPVAVAAGVLLLTVASAVGLSFLYAQSERNLARAIAAEEIARSEANTASRTSEFLVGIFDDATPEKARGETITAREILDEGAAKIRRQLADEPVVQARLMDAIGEAYRRLGLDDRARPLIEESLAARVEHLGPGHAEVGRSRNRLALLLEHVAGFDSARVEFARAVEILEGAGPEARIHLADTQSNLGWLLGQMSEYEEAGRLLDESVATIESQEEPDLDRLANALVNRSTVRLDTGRFDEARADLERALEIMRERLGENHPDLANGLTNLGIVYAMTGRPEEAYERYHGALTINEKVHDPVSLPVAESLGNVAISLAMQGRFEEALVNLERSHGILVELYGPEHPSASQCLHNLGQLHLDSGDPAKALEYLEPALDSRARTLGDVSTPVAYTLFAMAESHRALGDLPRARDLYARVVEIDSEILGPDDPEVGSDLEELVAVLRELGQDAEADAAEARMRAIFEAAEAGD